MSLRHWQRVRELLRSAPDVENARAMRLEAAAEILNVGWQRLFLRNFRDNRFGGKHHAGNATGIFQRRTGHLGRVDYAALHQMTELTKLGVESPIAFAFAYIIEDYFAGMAGVLSDEL